MSFLFGWIMSGHKRATVSISQEEYDRLRESAILLRMEPEVQPQVTESINQQSSRALEADMQQMRQRQAQLEAALAGANQSIYEVEQATTQAIQQYETSAIADIQNYTGSLWDHFAAMLDEHSRYFEAEIAESHRQQQEQLLQVGRQMRKMSVDQDQKRELAEDWLNSARTFCTFIHENYAHEVFAPGQMEKLERQLAQAELNLESGLSEGVIITSQRLYSAFSDLRVALERSLNEWQMLLRAATEAVSQLQARAEAAREVPAVDLDGNLESSVLDVDFWTEGRLSLFQQEMDYLTDLLNSPDNPPDSASLERWLSVDLPAYRNALGDIIEDARVRLLNSQLRINTADTVIRALQAQGFNVLLEHDYLDEDQRSTYLAHMAMGKSEVIIQVEPVGESLGENELHLESLDSEMRTDHELRQRWQEISRALAYFGLSVGPYEREDTHNLPLPTTSSPSSAGQSLPSGSGSGLRQQQLDPNSHDSGSRNGY